MISTYVPGWMSCKGAPIPPKAPTEAEKKAFDESARKYAEAARKRCKEEARYLNVIPFYGQAAYAAAVAACDILDWGADDSGVFGPVSQEQRTEIEAEVARGAPPAPTPPIIEATAEKKAAYATAKAQYERAYAQWKVADVEAAIPVLSDAALVALTPEQRKTRAEDVARLTVMAERLCRPTWLQVVLRAKAKDSARQMAGTGVSRGIKVAAGVGLAGALGLAAWLVWR